MTKTNDAVALDLMALADVAQPRKIVDEIHRQLRLQYGSVPLPVPLEGIAAAAGIEDIVDHETENFEGTLFVVGGRGIVALKRGLPTGRRRFTLGHEIGHFLNPWHRSTSSRFECSLKDTRLDRLGGGKWVDRPPRERMEIEANEFANAVLLPTAEFAAERRPLGSDPDIRHILHLRDRFGTSLEVMAQQYVRQSKDNVAAVLSRHGRMTRLISPNEFPFLGLQRGMPLPHDSLTAKMVVSGTPGDMSDWVDVYRTGWLERRGRTAGLHEQVLVQTEGWAMTLLWAEKTDEDEDDRGWNRQSGNRFNSF